MSCLGLVEGLHRSTRIDGASAVGQAGLSRMAGTKFCDDRINPRQFAGPGTPANWQSRAFRPAQSHQDLVGVVGKGGTLGSSAYYP